MPSTERCALGDYPVALTRLEVAMHQHGRRRVLLAFLPIIGALAGCHSLGVGEITPLAMAGGATAVASVIPPRTGTTVSVNEENDTFSPHGTDDEYTNGFGVRVELGNVTQAERSALRWPLRQLLDHAGSAPSCNEEHRIGSSCVVHSLALTQAMYTPATRMAQRDTTDRPYAGVLLLRYAIRNQSAFSADEFTIASGVLGPASRAEAVQSWIHKYLAHVPRFNGWQNQMANEVVGSVEYAHRHRTWLSPPSSGLGADATWVAGGMAGNLMDYARVGATLRSGYDLSPSWGQYRLTGTRRRKAAQAAEAASAYTPAVPEPGIAEISGYVDGELRGVLYNATVDRAPRGVSRGWTHHTPLVAEGGPGVSVRVALSDFTWWVPDLSASYQYVWRSSEIEGRTLGPKTGTHRYGVFVISAGHPTF